MYLLLTAGAQCKLQDGAETREHNVAIKNNEHALQVLFYFYFFLVLFFKPCTILWLYFSRKLVSKPVFLTFGPELYLFKMSKHIKFVQIVSFCPTVQAAPHLANYI